MKKVLLCGASNFLIANLIRYMSYRTKDYEFVSIDNLKKPNNYKLIYINKNHKFYIGDPTDIYFMDRIIFIEKPDIIVNGINSEYVDLLELSLPMEEYKTHLSSVVLEKYKIPVIQLSYPEKYNSYYDQICNLTFKNNGVVLELPNCFGIRQKTSSGLAKVIKESIQFFSEPGSYIPTVNVSSLPGPWAYAEDIASFIWFIMEQDFFGKKGKVMRIPCVGKFSTEDVVKVAIEVLQKEIDYFNIAPWSSFIKEYGKEHSSTWKPDSQDLKGKLQKTISWYNANKWILE